MTTSVFVIKVFVGFVFICIVFVSTYYTILKGLLFLLFLIKDWWPRSQDTYFNNPARVRKATSEKAGFFIMNECVIYKTRSVKGISFTQVSNNVVNSETLTLSAKGLYTYLIGRPDNWTVYKRQLAKVLPDTYYAIIKAWKELEEEGYIVSEQIRKSGRYVGWKYYIHTTSTTIEELKEEDEIEFESPFLNIKL